MGKKALLVVDMQNDFMPGGALPVPDGDKIVPVINQALNSSEYDLKITSKDAHPQKHISFKAQGGPWPVHCVKNTQGYEFTEGLEGDKFDRIIEKGSLSREDSYSAFYNAPEQPSELISFLKGKEISELYICGVALEYCVKETVEDALKQGLKVFVLKGMIKPIDAAKAPEIYQELKEKGAVIR